MKPSRLGYILVVVLAGFVISPAWAESAGQDAKSQDPLTQFKDVTKTLDGLRIYNRQLERQLDDQKRVMEQLNTSIESAESTRRQLVPLLKEMVASLQSFVDLDLPFDLKQRQARIDDLKAEMNRPDLSVAEKFKKVLDAYQKELDYGTSYETYSQFITVNGHNREVDILRWGRLVLAFQTPDQAISGVWDNKAKKWKVLDSRFAGGIRKAFRVARGITSKAFVILPVPAPSPEGGPETAQN